MSEESEAIDYFSYLPPEILVKIFGYVPPTDIYGNVAMVSKRWREVVLGNLKRMPLMPVHCFIQVMDMEGNFVTDDFTNPLIQYYFSLFDRTRDDYKQKLRQCREGNLAHRELFMAHRGGNLECVWGGSDKMPQRADSELIRKILKYVEVEALRFEVRKQGRKLVSRLTDDRFAQALAFLEQICGKVQAKSLYLSSRSPHFPWCFAAQSSKRFQGLHGLQSLILENMTAIDCLGEGPVLGGVDLSQIRHLHLRMDVTHKQELENTVWYELDGSILNSLLQGHKRSLEFTAYNDVPQIVTAITAVDMCNFVMGWRSLVTPWIIRNIVFNSIVTISEFRTVGIRMNLFDQHHLEDIPYCRFRTFHPSGPNVLLELACYGNGTATQWSIRSGYGRKR
ncbi:unnamed protein product [Auanema sp. JU1783]|nr:unnamed protein product [Auanema sp. JU1783]